MKAVPSSLARGRSLTHSDGGDARGAGVDQCAVDGVAGLYANVRTSSYGTPKNIIPEAQYAAHPHYTVRFMLARFSAASMLPVCSACAQKQVPKYQCRNFLVLRALCGLAAHPGHYPLPDGARSPKIQCLMTRCQHCAVCLLRRGDDARAAWDQIHLRWQREGMAKARPRHDNGCCQRLFQDDALFRTHCIQLHPIASIRESMSPAEQVGGFRASA